MYLFNHLKIGALQIKRAKWQPGIFPPGMSGSGAEDQIVIYHFLDGTGGVDPATAAPGCFFGAKNPRILRDFSV